MFDTSGLQTIKMRIEENGNAFVVTFGGREKTFTMQKNTLSVLNKKRVLGEPDCTYYGEQ